MPLGLSPRVRGKPPQPTTAPSRKGSIPACAGETNHQQRSPDRNGGYPRVCGGNTGCSPGSCHSKGLSPRVRGKPLFHHTPIIVRRSIPACAGETAAAAAAARKSKVYPRVCGGNPRSPPKPPPFPGLSPRVRGKRRLAAATAYCARSIPACAGETERQCGTCPILGVYPRVCGGNFPSEGLFEQLQGLSPRVRGKRITRQGKPLGFRSIPACAGETSAGSAIVTSSGVYPRVCGGNAAAAEISL